MEDSAESVRCRIIYLTMSRVPLFRYSGDRNYRILSHLRSALPISVNFCLVTYDIFLSEQLLLRVVQLVKT